MKLEPMKPTPYTANGEFFYVVCVECSERVKSMEVLADMDGKAGDFYCPKCADQRYYSE